MSWQTEYDSQRIQLDDGHDAGICGWNVFLHILVNSRNDAVDRTAEQATFDQGLCFFELQGVDICLLLRDAHVGLSQHQVGPSPIYFVLIRMRSLTKLFKACQSSPATLDLCGRGIDPPVRLHRRSSDLQGDRK